MNYMIDGDNGSHCFSPYHNSSTCPKCNGENEERRNCDFCKQKERWSLTREMPDGLIRCAGCEKKNAHLCLGEGCGETVYGRDELCPSCKNNILQDIRAAVTEDIGEPILPKKERRIT